MRLIPLIIEGQRIIQLSQLTIDQANDLRSWLPKDTIKKLSFQGLDLADCIPFETYDYWFRTYHIQTMTYETILDF